jgi:cytochrome c-type biogenesis protein CcmH/NrfG
MAPMVASVARRGRWLFGPAPDLLLGCGGAYLVVFIGLAAAADWIEALLPIGLLALPILMISVPHYGATVLRVYERDEDRRAYRFFAWWTTLPIIAWFVAGVYRESLGSWLVTLYLTWSPWHYSGQNYGIALLLLGRRGVAVAPALKRWIYASFLLSFALVFVAAHTEGATATYAPGSLAGGSYRFVRLGIPSPLAAWLVLGLLGGYAASLLVSIVGLRRAARWRDLGPALSLMGLQALWFSIPVLSRATGWWEGLAPFDPTRAEYAFLWIAIGHALQYLWVTSYYARQTGAAPRRLTYLTKCLLAGGAAWGVPTLLFGPDLLGVRAFDAGHALLAAAAVNVHHFFLDGAIWKLRDGRIARILLRPHASPAASPASRRGLGLVPALVAIAGVLYVVSTTFGALEREYGVRRASDPPDFARLRLAAERLRWVGRDDPIVRYNLAMHALRENDLDGARRDLERSLALQRSRNAWIALGVVEQRAGAFRKALRAYDSALGLDPASVLAWSRKAQVLVRLGDLGQARAALMRALALAPERLDLARRLAELGRG